jgi:hypothetical protein
VAAEVLSSVPLDGGVPGADAGGPGIAAVAPDGTVGARSLPRAERRSRVAPAEDRSNDGLDAFGLDARLRELVDREQRAEAELAGALLGVAEGRLHRGLGFSTLDAFAQEALGISPRKARMLLRLARAARRVPTLGAAWRSGSLSFLRAYGLVPVALAAPEHAVRWVERARRVPCIRLEEELSAAVVLAELDPAGFAATGGVPAASAAPDPEASARRQAGAQATRPGEVARRGSETSRLMIHGPRDAIRLFRATLCTVRRHLERRTGRCPSQGEAFEAMLDHAFAEWLPQQA